MGQYEETFIIDEQMLGMNRMWTLCFWGFLNLQPWLTGLAAMQLTNLKNPISPMDWASVLKVVCIIHFVFDLLDRSASPFVEFLGCLMIPYAMHTFIKQYKSLDAASAGGLLL